MTRRGFLKNLYFIKTKSKTFFSRGHLYYRGKTLLTFQQNLHFPQISCLPNLKDNFKFPKFLRLNKCRVLGFERMRDLSFSVWGIEVKFVRLGDLLLLLVGVLWLLYCCLYVVVVLRDLGFAEIERFFLLLCCWWCVVVDDVLLLICCCEWR